MRGKKLMVKKLIYWGLGILAISFTIHAEPNSSTGKAEPATTRPAPEPIVPLNQIVAVVNEEIITQTDLDQAVIDFKQQLQASHAPIPSDYQLREDALQQLINYRMQLQMAARNNIKPTDAEVDNALDEIAKSHNVNLDQLKEQLRRQNTSYEEFRKKVTEQLIVSKLLQMMIAGKVQVTDQDIQEYKNQMPQVKEYQLADFFLPLPEKPTAQQLKSTLAAAQEIQKQIEQGLDIHSISPEFHDLGWRTKEDLPQLFVDQLPNLTLQNSSAPILAPNGYHVLKLLGERDKNALTEDQIKNLVFQKKYQAAAKEAMDKARKQAYIQIMVP